MTDNPSQHPNWEHDSMYGVSGSDAVNIATQALASVLGEGQFCDGYLGNQQDAPGFDRSPVRREGQRGRGLMALARPVDLIRAVFAFERHGDVVRIAVDHRLACEGPAVDDRGISSSVAAHL